jgi:hypothetical protein
MRVVLLRRGCSNARFDDVIERSYVRRRLTVVYGFIVSTFQTGNR